MTITISTLVPTQYTVTSRWRKISKIFKFLILFTQVRVESEIEFYNLGFHLQYIVFFQYYNLKVNIADHETEQKRFSPTIE